jgi:hypothetical protein
LTARFGWFHGKAVLIHVTDAPESDILQATSEFNRRNWACVLAIGVFHQQNGERENPP